MADAGRVLWGAMLGNLKGLVVTLKTMLRTPVTAQYPNQADRLAIADRFMGFPALTWDYTSEEPYCTGCMVCIRECPTQCMTAEMKDNPKHETAESRRRKIIDMFEINLGRCILCGICVDVCNFDAIEMSHEHELSRYQRNANRVDLPELLEMGKKHQVDTGLGTDTGEEHRRSGQGDQEAEGGSGRLMVTTSLVLFYIAGALTIGGALGVVMTRNIVYAAFALLASLMGVAGVFLLAFAEFLALVQVLIYGGAIVILILFALMLTRIEDFAHLSDNRQWPLAVVVALAIFGLMTAAILGTSVPASAERQGVPLEVLGESLFVTWAVPFEMASLVLLVALIGAVVLVRENGGRQ